MIWSGSLASWDEAMYAQVAKEMVQSGDYVHLAYRGADWYVKPPLYLWGTALFYLIWGVNEFTARIFSGLSGVATVLAVYFLGRLLFDRRAALFGAGVLLSSTDFLHFARWGMTDMTNLAFFTAAIACFAVGRSKDIGLIGFWFFCGCAFMTKGPVIALAVAIVLIYGAASRDFGFLRKKAFWIGFAVAACLVIPWHLVAYLHNPKLFLGDYIGKHWFSRSVSAIDGHIGNYYFYIRTLINKYHPWVILLPLSVPFIAAKALRHQGSRLILVWIAVIFGFFTFLVGTKLHWYILPIDPALSLSVGVFLAFVVKDRFDSWVKILIAVVLFLHIPFSSVIVQDYSPGIKALRPVVQAEIGREEGIYLFQFHEEPASVFYLEKATQYIDSFEELDRRLREEAYLHIVTPVSTYRENEAGFIQRGFRSIRQTEDLKTDLILISNKV